MIIVFVVCLALVLLQPLVESLIIILFYEILLLLSIFILCRVYSGLILEWVIICSTECLVVRVLLLVYILKVLRCFACRCFVPQFRGGYGSRRILGRSEVLHKLLGPLDLSRLHSGSYRDSAFGLLAAAVTLRGSVLVVYESC